MPRAKSAPVDSGDLPTEPATETPAVDAAPAEKPVRAPRKAKNIPVLKTNSIESGEQEMTASSFLADLKELIVRPEHEPLVGSMPLEAAKLDPEYMAALAFMEEHVLVEVQETTDENAEPMPAVYVNGKAQYFPRGVEVKCRRKYLEGLVRAKPISIMTKVEERNSENPTNRILKRAALKYPFRVVEDSNPRGAAWLRALLLEDQVA